MVLIRIVAGTLMVAVSMVLLMSIIVAAISHKKPIAAPIIHMRPYK